MLKTIGFLHTQKTKNTDTFFWAPHSYYFLIIKTTLWIFVIAWTMLADPAPEVIANTQNRVSFDITRNNPATPCLGACIVSGDQAFGAHKLS